MFRDFVVFVSLKYFVNSFDHLFAGSVEVQVHPQVLTVLTSGLVHCVSCDDSPLSAGSVKVQLHPYGPQEQPRLDLFSSSVKSSGDNSASSLKVQKQPFGPQAQPRLDLLSSSG